MTLLVIVGVETCPITAINNRLPHPKMDPTCRHSCHSMYQGWALRLCQDFMAHCWLSSKKKVSRIFAPNLSSFMLLACVFCTSSPSKKINKQHRHRKNCGGSSIFSYLHRKSFLVFGIRPGPAIWQHVDASSLCRLVKPLVVFLSSFCWVEGGNGLKC